MSGALLFIWSSGNWPSRAAEVGAATSVLFSSCHGPAFSGPCPAGPPLRGGFLFTWRRVQAAGLAPAPPPSFIVRRGLRTGHEPSDAMRRDSMQRWQSRAHEVCSRRGGGCRMEMKSLESLLRAADLTVDGMLNSEDVDEFIEVYSDALGGS